MAYKLMYIPNVDTQNYPYLKITVSLDTQLNEPTNQYLISPQSFLANELEKKLL